MIKTTLLAPFSGFLCECLKGRYLIACLFVIFICVFCVTPLTSSKSPATFYKLTHNDSKFLCETKESSFLPKNQCGRRRRFDIFVSVFVVSARGVEEILFCWIN